MVRLTNGLQTSKGYEKLQMHTSALTASLIESRKTQGDRANSIKVRMQELMADYESGLISKDTLQEYLVIPKRFFDSVPPPYPEEMNAEEIKDFIAENGSKFW